MSSRQREGRYPQIPTHTQALLPTYASSVSSGCVLVQEFKFRSVVHSRKPHHLLRNQRCLAQHPEGKHHTKKADDTKQPSQASQTTHTHTTQVPRDIRTSPTPPRSVLIFRAPHARRLLPTAMAFVSYGFVLVRVRVRAGNHPDNSAGQVLEGGCHKQPRLLFFRTSVEKKETDQLISDWPKWWLRQLRFRR